MTKSPSWKSIKDHPLHEISDDGQVRNIKTGAILTGSLFNGYRMVHLSSKDRKNLRVHVLVLEAFIGPRPTPGAHGRHLDGNKKNNSLSNLAWGSCQDNTDDRKIHGRIARGERSGRAKLSASDVKIIRDSFPPAYGIQSKMAREYGVRVSTVNAILWNKLWADAEYQKKLEAMEKRDIALRSYGI